VGIGGAYMYSFANSTDFEEFIWQYPLGTGGESKYGRSIICPIIYLRLNVWGMEEESPMYYK
jgi:hypothetical protein